jgi:hypothetical protein
MQVTPIRYVHDVETACRRYEAFGRKLEARTPENDHALST